MDLKRVVVTGLGAITPIGNNLRNFWESLLNGVSGSAPITRFDTSKFKTKFACEVKNYDPNNFFDRKETRKIDLFTQYALVSAQEAMADSKIDTSLIDLDKAGVIWSSGIGGLDTFMEEMTGFLHGDGTPRFSPFFIPKMISDIAGGRISIQYGFRGPNFTTTSACASSSNAIIDAYNYIRLGKASIMISGGSEAAIGVCGIGGFNAMHAISTRNDDPATASRPFDKDRDGFVLGEGGAALVLEELEHALNRGAQIYCELAGAGLSADAYHITQPHPEGFGAEKVMKNALEDAGMTPEEIDYINTHGTSTPLGDISECKAIIRAFGEHAYKLNLSSSKSMTGHLLGAAGAIESIATVMSIKNDVVSPTINHFTDDPEIDNRLNFTFHQKQHKIIRTGMCNTFGFGGHNATIIFKKYIS
ncbi:MAG: beta-ketoacyl-ACP synthase II [Bacteroidales bacterium]|jgi:3-oxoacyl-[acyl-carrier-protein] synthase II|nr:beta-ketoacyl-ACP synthase II [Bacteroidales bacterium]MDD4213319.1 beta-ketoacyl-ACP synthase II [Bacteroidales bacterium]